MTTSTSQTLEYDERLFIDGEEKFKIYNVDTLDKMYHKYHDHEFIELFILLSGSVKYSLEQGTLLLKSFDIVLVPPHVLHKLTVLENNETYKRMVLWIKKDYLASLSSAKTDLCSIVNDYYEKGIFLIRNHEFTFSIKKYISRIEQFLKEDQFGNDLLIENTIRELFLSLGNYLIINHPSNIDTMSNPMVTKVIEYIDHNLSRDLSLSSIAKALSFETSYVSRVFSNATQLSLHKYVIKKRLTTAKKYLLEGKSVKETIQLVGFNDESHFVQVFKKEFGITPKRYQMQVINK